jgi:ferredoxin--NADP+ reductase
MRLDDYDTTVRFDAVVHATERITPEHASDEVRELALDIERPGFSYHAGQSVGVLAPPDPAFGHQHHLRLYSIADIPEGDEHRSRIKICVRRCNYIDGYSGETYKGVASNYLCDLAVGDHLTLCGPFGIPFAVPAAHDANLVLIGSGTGIAPFRALIKHIYHNVADWTGQIRLFYGAMSGLELLYMNEERNDLALYCDRDTFEAIQALSPRPHFDDPIAWGRAFGARGEELTRMLEDANTYVYIAGLEDIRDELHRVLAKVIGSDEAWRERHAQLVADGRWVELLY